MLITKDRTNKIAKVLGSLIGNNSATTITLSELASVIMAYRVNSNGISILTNADYSVNQVNSVLTLNFTPKENELILVTTDGKLLFENLYVFSNLALSEQRSIVDEMYIHADTNKLINISVSSETYSAPPNAPTVQFSFSLDAYNYSPSVTISQILKGQDVKVYCKASVPANVQIGSFINYAIVVDAQEVPE